MKKIIAAILTGNIIISSVGFVCAEDICKIEGTDYYYEEENDGGIYFCDEKGNKLDEQLFYEIKVGGNALIVRYYGGEYNNMVTIVDMTFKPVIEIKYDYIEYNENTKCYECFYYDDYERIDFFDSNFNKVSQPRDIRELEGTDFYYESIIDEKNANREYIFICDWEGNRLIEEGFADVRAEKGNIVVMRFDGSKRGIYDKDLRLVKDIVYDNIYFNEDTQLFELTKWIQDEQGNFVSDIEYLNINLEEDKPIRKLENSIYYTVEENDGTFYICDEDGKHLSEKPYYEIEYLGDDYIKVRSSNKYPYRYGLIDLELNTVIEEIYFNISYNDKIYCYDNGKTVVYDAKTSEVVNKFDNDIFYVTQIKGMEGRYVYNRYPDNNMPDDSEIIIDDNGNCLSKNYMSISTEVGPGNTIIVETRAGMTDSRHGILNSDFTEIIPTEQYHVEAKEENGVVYIVANVGEDHYYDILGNEYSSISELIEKNGQADVMSDWARESVEKAIEYNIVPENLKGFYTSNITREEFCQLAIKTYIARTGYEMDYAESPFTDVNNVYVTNASKLKIVAGVGDNKFAPDNNITRQEAAVMLNNLADLLGIDSICDVDKFEDESNFADWAKEAIYSVITMRSGDTYVMVGTGDSKFSPLMNYTREQAIVTMFRIYNCN